MEHEVNVTVAGQEHCLRGARAKKFLDILAQKFAANPELQHAGRLERRAAEEQAFIEATQEGN
jgi:hypothetical protein